MFEESVSVASIWASMNSWFTPAVLFVLLNVMIVTIAYTSSFANQRHHNQQTPHDPQQQPRLAMSPSVLQRLKSIDLYSFRSQLSIPSPSITTHFKPSPDSDIRYPREQIHPHQTPETDIQYVFQQTREQELLKTETQYVFQQTHEQETLKTESQYDPEQTLDEEEEELKTMDEIYSQLTDHHVSRTKSDTKPASGEVPIRLPMKMRKSASMKSPFGHFEEEGIVEARRPATVKEGKAGVKEVDDEVDAKADDFINRFKQQLKLQRLDSIMRYKEMITRDRGNGK